MSTAILGRRVCAAVAVCSAGLHVLMVSHVGSLTISVLLIAMALACLYCARDLWTGGSLRAWCVVALMSLGMVAIHFTVPGCHPGALIAADALTPPTMLMSVATAVALAEAVIATAVLAYRTRGRSDLLAAGQLVSPATPSRR
jgi:hypothetical protein